MKLSEQELYQIDAAQRMHRGIPCKVQPQHYQRFRIVYQAMHSPMALKRASPRLKMPYQMSQQQLTAKLDNLFQENELITKQNQKLRKNINKESKLNDITFKRFGKFPSIVRSKVSQENSIAASRNGASIYVQDENSLSMIDQNISRNLAKSSLKLSRSHISNYNQSVDLQQNLMAIKAMQQINRLQDILDGKNWQLSKHREKRQEDKMIEQKHSQNKQILDQQFFNMLYGKREEAFEQTMMELQDCTLAINQKKTERQNQYRRLAKRTKLLKKQLKTIKNDIISSKDRVEKSGLRKGKRVKTQNSMDNSTSTAWNNDNNIFPQKAELNALKNQREHLEGSIQKIIDQKVRQKIILHKLIYDLSEKMSPN